MASLHVIFGNGPVGSSAARFLLKQGNCVRIASRTGRRSDVLFDDLTDNEQSRLEFRPADALDPKAVQAASSGASHLYHCVNVPYQDWKKKLPFIQQNLVAAALQERAVLAVAENLYSYARGVPVITEDTPELPPTRKGLLRKHLHDRLIEAGKSQGLAWTSVRASDYFGPGAVLQSPFGSELFLDPLAQGKRPRVIGDPDQPHTYAYVEDFGRALAVAALDTRAHGNSWIVPNDRTVTAREIAQMFFDKAGVPAILGTIPRFVIALAGVFNPLLREVVEMLYQKEEPYIVDGSRFAALFAFEPTPLEVGVQRTLEWHEASRARERLAAV